MSKQSNLKILLNGIIKENPVLVLILGTMPDTGRHFSGGKWLGHGPRPLRCCRVADMAISLFRKVIPDKVLYPELYRNYRRLCNDCQLSFGGVCTGYL